jgi:hypothetical protein
MITYPSLGKNGELANQLFQIAATTSHAHTMNIGAIIPSCQDNLLVTTAITVRDEIPIYAIYTEPHFYYDPIPKKDNISLSGYFQSEKYFQYNANFIRKIFRFNDNITNYIYKKYGYILNRNNTVGVHMRTYSRGVLDVRSIHCDVLENIDYLKSAFNFFGKKNTFVICSDNIDYVKQKLGDSGNFVYITNEPNYIDLCLLSKCKHNIGSASSFSWWAAWLNENVAKRVIMPKKYFNVQVEQDTWYDTRDIYPENWIIF